MTEQIRNGAHFRAEDFGEEAFTALFEAAPDALIVIDGPAFSESSSS